MRGANDCPHCEELRERVAWLESELGLQRDASLISAIKSALPAGLSRPAVAQLIAALYQAKGRPMTRFQLLEAVPSKHNVDERDEHIIDVWVASARKALGKDVVATVWGRGFQLSPIGMKKVADIIGAGERAAA